MKNIKTHAPDKSTSIYPILAQHFTSALPENVRKEVQKCLNIRLKAFRRSTIPQKQNKCNLALG